MGWTEIIPKLGFPLPTVTEELEKPPLAPQTFQNHWQWNMVPFQNSRPTLYRNSTYIYTYLKSITWIWNQIKSHHRYFKQWIGPILESQVPLTLTLGETRSNDTGMWVPPVMIHISVGFSIINHPAIGVPPWLWKPPNDRIHDTCDKGTAVLLAVPVLLMPHVQLWRKSSSVQCIWLNYSCDIYFMNLKLADLNMI